MNWNFIHLKTLTWFLQLKQKTSTQWLSGVVMVWATAMVSATATVSLMAVMAMVLVWATVWAVAEDSGGRHLLSSTVFQSDNQSSTVQRHSSSSLLRASLVQMFTNETTTTQQISLPSSPLVNDCFIFWDFQLFLILESSRDVQQINKELLTWKLEASCLYFYLLNDSFQSHLTWRVDIPSRQVEDGKHSKLILICV